eukprot:Nk52_evm1s2047 gene=Nk52_evmTU1s2047
MDNATFSVLFSEPVDFSTFSDMDIRIRDTANSIIDCHLDSFTIGPDALSLTFHINKAALDKIKLNQQLAVDKESTFITFANNTIYDMRGNELVGGTFGVIEHIPDTTPVVLIGYSIDYSVGQIKLDFEEP